MNIDQFYYIKARSSFTATIMDDSLSKHIYDLQQGNYEGIKFPVYFKHCLGTKKLREILETDFRSYLISEKVKNVLEENHLTGWKTYPIKLFYRRMVPIEGYYGFSVTGKCGAADYSKSELLCTSQMYPSGTVVKQYEGLYINLNKWDKTDFFYPEGSPLLIVTERVKDILKEFNGQIEYTNLKKMITECFEFKKDKKK